jgi:hypothetical protein
MSLPAIEPRATKDLLELRALLLIAYWYPPENESGALRPARFSKYLPRHGFNSHVLAAPLSSGLELAGNVHRTQSEQQLAPRGWRALLGQMAQRAAPYNDRLEWVTPAYESARQLASETHFAAIVSTSPPLACHLVAWLLAKRNQLPWIADFRDPLVGNPFRTRRLGKLYDRMIERRIVARASAIVVNTDTALDAFARRYPKFQHKLHLIWNGYDPQDDLQAAPIAPRRYKLLAHFGALYGARHPGIVLHSLERLIRGGRVDPDTVRVRLVGSIDRDEAWLKSGAFTFLRERRCLEYTEATVPREQAREEMTRADYLLLLDLNQLAAGVQVPAKLFEYVRVGRPVLALTTRNSPVQRILSGAQTPHVCIYVDDAEAEIDRNVREFLDLPTAPVAPSRWFHEQFDSVAQTSLLAAVIEAKQCP